MGDPAREGSRDIAGLTGATLFARAAELSAAGRSYAVASVVAVRRPTSARPGAHGIVHPDGSIEGWVGGSCAQPVVVREALRSLVDGQPRLVRISKEPPSDSRRGDGIVEVIMTCHSGGTLEVYVEPQLPAPVLWVAGITPIAGALATLGAAAGFTTTLVDPIADAGAFPGATVAATTNLRRLEPDATPYVVVATQGVWDEEAVESALRRDHVAYVGLVASPTRAAVVREYLAQVELPAERIAALRAPAGLDVGAETPEEIALSILTELVQVRRGRADFVAAPGPATLAGDASVAERAVAPAHSSAGIVLLDPVCGMTVTEADVRHLAEHDGTVYAFCSVGCRVRFIREPTAYVGSAARPVT